MVLKKKRNKINNYSDTNMRPKIDCEIKMLHQNVWLKSLKSKN